MREYNIWALFFYYSFILFYFLCATYAHVNIGLSGIYYLREKTTSVVVTWSVRELPSA